MADNEEKSTEQQNQEPQTQQEELVDYSYAEGKAIKVPKELVDSINGRVAATNHQYKEKNNKLSNELNELKVQLEEIKLSQMTDKEKIELAEKKRLKELEDAKKAALDNDSKFKNYYLDTELYKGISSYSTHNPKQAVNLLKAEYKHEFVADENGDVQIVFNVNGSQVSVQEALKTFFNDPSNQNLLKSEMKAGSGTKPGSLYNAQANKTTFKRSELDDPEISKIYRDRLRSGLEVSIID